MDVKTQWRKRMFYENLRMVKVKSQISRNGNKGAKEDMAM
jgi:hypothetical protein